VLTVLVGPSILYRWPVQRWVRTGSRRYRDPQGSATLHQLQIGVKLFTIIGFAPQLLAIIGYYCY
jgi:hypothetical protein